LAIITIRSAMIMALVIILIFIKFIKVIKWWVVVFIK